MSSHNRWLHDEVAAWLKDGLVTEEQGRTLRGHYPVEADGKGWGRLVFSIIGAVAETEMFRIVYGSPTPEQIAALGDPEDIWLGELPTQSFNARGRVD